MKVLDPRILQQEPSYQIRQGSGSVSYNKYAPTSASVNTLDFNVNPPTEDIVTQRDIKYEGSPVLKSNVTLTVKKANGQAGTLPTAVKAKGQPLVMFGYNSTITDHPLNHIFENTQVALVLIRTKKITTLHISNMPNIVYK
mgnify:CR=1 FL=1